MEIEIIDGFKFEKIISRGKIIIGNLLVESSKLNETTRYIVAKKIKGVSLNSAHGYFIKTIDFIINVKDVIEYIDIVQDDIDLKGIESAHQLKTIYLGGENKYPLNFSYFKNLESCSISWNKKITNLNSCKKLKRLSLRKFPCMGTTTDFLTELSQLESLEFIQSKFIDLDFLKYFPKLKDFELWHMAALENIDGLRFCANSLDKLILDHCKKIESYDVLKQLFKLKWLNVTDSRELENLDFLKQLKKLEHFAFVNTNVVNGDISPAIGIKHVGFFNKKHYSHTSEEIKKINNSIVK